MGNTRSSFVSKAAAEVGYKETGNNHTKYATYFDTPKSKGGAWQFFNTKKQGSAWCSLFPHYISCHLIGIEPTRSLFGEPKVDNCAAGVPYFWGYLTKKGYKVDKSKGQAGDIIFLNGNKHVGIIEKVDAKKYYTIEGNKSNAVKRSSYAKGSSSVYGICHIPWEKFDKAETPAEPEPVKDQLPEPVNPVTPAKPASKPASGKTYTVRVNTVLNVRNAPNGRIVGKLKNGTKVTVYEQKNGWGRIGTGKWVFMQYLH